MFCSAAAWLLDKRWTDFAPPDCPLSAPWFCVQLYRQISFGVVLRALSAESVAWECCTVLNSAVTSRHGGVWALLPQNLPAVKGGLLAEQHSEHRQNQAIY